MPTTDAPDLKPLTIDNLKAANACTEGMRWITPLLKAEDPQVCEKLHAYNKEWFFWAIGNGFDVYSQLSEEYMAANDMLPMATSGYRANASTSGDLANASTSGDLANASTSGYRANASTSGDLANASTSGRASFAFARGPGSRVRGVDAGCCIIAAYYNDAYTVAHVATGTVGEDGIEAGVWYEADRNTGKLRKADDQTEPDWENEAI